MSADQKPGLNGNNGESFDAKIAKRAFLGEAELAHAQRFGQPSLETTLAASTGVPRHDLNGHKTPHIDGSKNVFNMPAVIGDEALHPARAALLAREARRLGMTPQEYTVHIEEARREAKKVIGKDVYIADSKI